MLTAVIIIAAIIAIILALAASKSSEFRVERSITINAPPERIYPLINDFRNWLEWSPWEGLDPNLQRTHSGAPQGVGAHYAWEGNKKAGAGSMEITEAIASTRIVVRLDFLKPFKANNIVAFTLTPAGGGTVVNWAMWGPRPFAIKIMEVFTSMDSLVGKDFEKGLASLKVAAEK